MMRAPTWKAHGAIGVWKSQNGPGAAVRQCPVSGRLADSLSEEAAIWPRYLFEDVDVKFLVGMFLTAAFVPGFALAQGRGETNCKTVTVATSWSPDRVYEASLLEKNCNMGESLFYSLRMDALPQPGRRGWLVTGYELENDLDHPASPPAMKWATPRRLEIDVVTRTLAGSLERSVGDDLTVVRRYVPTERGAHPNY